MYFKISDVFMLVIFFKANIVVARVMGIYNINEYLKAVSLFRFVIIPPTIVAPLLLIPGKSATTWKNPIINASVFVISFSFLYPFRFLIIYKNIAVIISANPIGLIFVILLSIKSFSSNPIIPAGIVPIIIKIK